MAFLKKNSQGKKQVAMPGPNSAAYKKLLAKNSAQSGANQGNKNKKKPAPAFSTLKSKQLLLERVKREIWAAVLTINRAIIQLASAGNLHAAKALFDFAGVYAVPAPDDDNYVKAGAAPVLVGKPAETSETPSQPDPVESFFRSIGVEPPNALPEPSMASVG